jgi:glucosylceramidase
MPSNGLRPDQVGVEGSDMFIQDDLYFKTYAAYFARFIQEYRGHGINISMVMPQNEFNSPQPFPSCCWTPQGLARFLAFLGPEMQKLNVEVFLGTLERADDKLVDVPLLDPTSGKYINGVGCQWAGRRAIPGVHIRYPYLKLYQTEQECGDGRNDWRYCRWAWTLMNVFLRNGTSAYYYWNISLKQGGLSRWGWAQNSLVTVDTAAKTFNYNYEYYLMKHLSRYVQAGARRLDTMTLTGHDNLLVFANPDNSVVILTQNEFCEDTPIRIKVGDNVIAATLQADSFNTFAVRT